MGFSSATIESPARSAARRRRNVSLSKESGNLENLDKNGFLLLQEFQFAEFQEKSKISWNVFL
jgi:hypothetical protein